MSLNYLEKWNKEENIPEDIFSRSTSGFESCILKRYYAHGFRIGSIIEDKYIIFFTRSKVEWYLTLVYPGLSHL